MESEGVGVGSDCVGDGGVGDSGVGGGGGGGGSYTLGPYYWQWVVLLEGNNSSNKLRQ